MVSPSQLEFSRLISIEGIVPDKVREESVAATAEECAALARRFDLRELSDLKATISIRRISGGQTVRLAGKFEADIVQACGVSLRDVPDRIESEFETFFTQAPPQKTTGEIEIPYDESDESVPEFVVNGMIDLGEVVAQYLSLEIDPYPRAPGVSLAAQAAESGAEVKNTPFAALADVAAGDKKKDK